MEKRAAAESGYTEEKWSRCRNILQRALTLNPAAVQVIQAWGLMELQRGNLLPAVRLLERCATADPICAPVLRWKLVQEARKTVGSRNRNVQVASGPPNLQNSHGTTLLWGTIIQRTNGFISFFVYNFIYISYGSMRERSNGADIFQVMKNYALVHIIVYCDHECLSFLWKNFHNDGVLLGR